MSFATPGADLPTGGYNEDGTQGSAVPGPAAPASSMPAVGPPPRQTLEIEAGTAAFARALEIHQEGQELDLPGRVNLYLEAIEREPENLALRYCLARLHLDYGLLEEATVQLAQLVRRFSHSIVARKALLECYLWSGQKEQACETLLEISEVYHSRGQSQEAVDSVHHLLSLDPKNLLARRRLVDLLSNDKPALLRHHLQRLAELALGLRRLEEAQEALERLRGLGGSPGPAVEAKLARALEEEGAADRALELYRRVVERFLQEGDLARAARTLQRVLRLDPGSVVERKRAAELFYRLDEHFEAAEQLVALGDLQGQSEPLLRRALEICPDHRRARQLLVELLAEQQRADDLRVEADALEQVLRQEGNAALAADMWRDLAEKPIADRSWRERAALLYEMAGDAEMAAEQWCRLAQSDKDKGQSQDAARALARALNLDPRPDLQLELALLHRQNGATLEETLNEVRSLLRSFPDYVAALLVFVDLLLDAGAYEQAAASLARSKPQIQDEVLGRFRTRIARDPQDWEARLALGQLSLYLGQTEAAIEQFQKTRRHPPLTFRSLHLLGRAFSSQEMGMSDLAVQLMKKALDVPEAPEMERGAVRYDLAWLLCDLGRVEEAWEELARCRASDPGRDVSVLEQRLSGLYRVESEGYG